MPQQEESVEDHRLTEGKVEELRRMVQAAEQAVVDSEEEDDDDVQIVSSVSTALLCLRCD